MSYSRLSHEEIESKLFNHDFFLDLCDSERLRLDFPILSHFRVFALVIVRDASGTLHCIAGTNTEPCDIAGSICAERSALVQCRFISKPKIEFLYISTDRLEPLAPGSLCRSFLLQYSDENSICIFAGTDKRLTKTTRIFDFYPHPSIYLKLTASESMEFGQGLTSVLPRLTCPDISLSDDFMNSIYQSVVKSAHRTNKSHVNPLMYAAVLIWGEVTRFACQLTAYEYGCSLDAVSQLVSFMEHEGFSSREDSGIILHCDQFGVLHAPTAQGRALLCEFGFGYNIQIGVHVRNGDGSYSLIYVRPSELLPDEARFSII